MMTRPRLRKARDKNIRADLELNMRCGIYEELSTDVQKVLVLSMCGNVFGRGEIIVIDGRRN